MSFKNILSLFQKNSGKALPVLIKKGTQIVDADSNVGYEYDGEKWVQISYYCKVGPVTTSSFMPSSAVSDAVRRENERRRQCSSIQYKPTVSSNDTITTSVDNAYYTASLISDSSSEACSSFSYSSSSSSYSSDSSSSCDSSSSSGCD